MDNFINRIAGKFVGQEAPRTSIDGGGIEMRRQTEQTDLMKKSLLEYDLWTQEVRSLNARNVENAQAIRNLIYDAQIILDSCREAFTAAPKSSSGNEHILSISEDIIAMEELIAKQGRTIGEVSTAQARVEELVSVGGQTIAAMNAAQARVEEQLISSGQTIAAMSTAHVKIEEQIGLTARSVVEIYTAQASLEELISVTSRSVGEINASQIRVEEQINTTARTVLEINTAQMKLDEQIRTAMRAIEEMKSSQSSSLDELREVMKGSQESFDLIKNIRTDIKSDLETAIHTENVKVYRNVQAVVVEEANKQAVSILECQKQIKNTHRSLFIMIIAALLLGLGNMGLLLLMSGLLPF
ncbi:MAG: hypothetical protein LBC96_00515 [Lachnospiraceae bacterium]|jgi:hypothetical protein|nr:hypothetical protein [Lachnospiraceae bacterium]